MKVHFRFENSTDRRNRILSGLVPQVYEHSTHISQHLIPIHCKTVFREFTKKLNSKWTANHNPLGHYSDAGEIAWICCQSTWTRVALPMKSSKTQTRASLAICSTVAMKFANGPECISTG